MECIDESCGMVVEKGNLNELLNALQIIKEKGKSIYMEHCIRLANTIYDKSERYNDYLNLSKKILVY